MKKYFYNLYFFLFIFFTLITVYKQWFNPYYILFWLGGFLGTILVDLDEFVYIYYLEPNDPSSLNAKLEISKKHFVQTWKNLAATRRSRSKLIFHTATFNIFFLILAFLVLTSTGSIFGHGLVLGFSSRLFIDQMKDFRDLGNLDSWFRQIQLNLDRDRVKLYLIANFITLLVFGFFL